MIKNIFPIYINDNQRRYVNVDAIVDFVVTKKDGEFFLSILALRGEYKKVFKAKTEQEILNYIFNNFMQKPEVKDELFKIEQKGNKFYLYERGKLIGNFLTENAAIIQTKRIEIARLKAEGN
jgi:hypothetical protein